MSIVDSKEKYKKIFLYRKIIELGPISGMKRGGGLEPLK